MGRNGSTAKDVIRRVIAFLRRAKETLRKHEGGEVDFGEITNEIDDLLEDANQFLEKSSWNDIQDFIERVVWILDILNRLIS
jgi:negative regulator of replication initiation